MNCKSFWIGVILGLVFLASPISAAESGKGFFRVKAIDGRWWFIDPADQPFYSIGVNYCLGVSLEYPPGSVGSPEYKKAFDEYESLSKRWSARLQRWKFNTCGSVYGNWNNRFPATPIFRCVQRARSVNVPNHKDFDFPDVYGGRFREVVEGWAERVIKPQANNPRIIGWFIDNEFHLPQDEAFQRQFFKVALGAIRKYDKNHLILGTRYESPNRSDMDIRIEGEFCDVLTVNYYTLLPSRERLERIHKLSGRPVLIGEFTFAAKDAGLPNARSWEGTLYETQFDRAQGYEIFTSHLAELPFVVGSHFFMLHDRTEFLPNNWGLADKNGKLYYGFVRHLAKVHERLPRIHAGTLEPKRYPRDYPDLKPGLNDFPRMTDQARIDPDGTQLWQFGYLHYACTPGAGPYFFDRTADETWGYQDGGFIEYRFTLAKPMQDAHLVFRYASYLRSTTHRLRVEINDEPVTVFACPRAETDLTSPPGWDYGFGPLRLATVTIPLGMEIPAGLTSVRFCTESPWKTERGMLVHGFFLSEGPGRVDPNNYSRLIKDTTTRPVGK